MTIYAGLRKMAAQEGVQLRRACWPAAEVYVSVQAGTVMIHQDDGMHHPWILRSDDLAARDWEVVPVWREPPAKALAGGEVQ